MHIMVVNLCYSVLKGIILFKFIKVTLNLLYQLSMNHLNYKKGDFTWSVAC